MERTPINEDLFDPIVGALRCWCEAEKTRAKELIDADRIEEAEEALRLLRPMCALVAKAEGLAAEFRAWCASSLPAKLAVAQAMATIGEFTKGLPPAPEAASLANGRREEPLPETSQSLAAAETSPEEEQGDPGASAGEETDEAPSDASGAVAEPSPVSPQRKELGEEAGASETTEPTHTDQSLRFEDWMAPSKPAVRWTTAQKNQWKSLEGEFREVCRRLRELDAKDSWSNEQLARAKADLCRLRAVELSGRALGADVRGIQEEIRYWGLVIGRMSGNGASPLATDQTNGKASDWRDFAAAFDCLAEGERAVAWIQENRGSTFYRDVLNDLAACGHIVYRLTLERRLPFDKQQEQFKKLIESLAGGSQIQCWLSPEHGGPKTDKVFKAAQGFRQRFESKVLGRMRALAREHALGELYDWVSKAENGQQPQSDEFLDTFLEVLEEKIQSCLDAGMQPSNKRLRELLMPYVTMLQPRDGRFRRLIEYVRGDATKAARTNYEALEGRDDAIQQIELNEHRRRLEELRPVLSGKRMLIVGGSIGQAHRRQLYQQALELSEVDWPEVEHDSHLDIFWPRLEKADIAVQLIRFSRHHYGEVLAKAREQGKMTARIKGGLNIRRFVLDLHEQLVANRSASAS
ncbi:MAG: hypothetical protein N2109_05130 [Fimbriimonadales bacterium]|nr:hypothetical protein [Fimbriimonadales bacterium]